MAQPLPPLNPLHVFEVAARLGSFSRAAEELNVTQSAVSRQVATLEGALGVRLFERDRRGALLTQVGKAYWTEIAPAFATISNATSKLIEIRKVEPLHLQVYTTFAAKWLVHRLPEFQARYGGINVRIHNSVQPVDFARDKIDVAIQLGDGNWPKMNSIKLFADVIQPICSPSLLAGRGPLVPEDLATHSILFSRYRRRDWTDWLTLSGRSDLKLGPMIEFPSSVLTYEAAAKGTGIAMGQIGILDYEIKNGLLVPLFDAPVERDLAYYVVWQGDEEPPRKVRAFLKWISQFAVADQPKN